MRFGAFYMLTGLAAVIPVLAFTTTSRVGKLWRASKRLPIREVTASVEKTDVDSDTEETDEEAPSAVVPETRRGSTLIGSPLRPVTIYPGDYVVHRDRGICQFIEVIAAGATTTASSFPENNETPFKGTVQGDDYDGRSGYQEAGQVKALQPGIKVLFADMKILMVQSGYLLSRLASADTPTKPKLARLGEKGKMVWQRQVFKAREEAKGNAVNLLALHAAREEIQREPCAFPDEGLFQKVVDSFAFEPTPDQVKCFNDIQHDMCSRKRPMDRLVCGDVGFGKTEVALRAIARAAMNGRQVALLAPTTVLAAQHLRTLRNRLGEHGLTVEILRGGTTQTKEGRKLREDIASGAIDIVVGTHAILSKKGVDWHNLGLLVVDEEQRFGVTQKERVKALTNNIDVLTLTATPIPRTLQLSLSGMRDLSTLETAPVGRKEVKTEVLAQDDDKIREAILFEVGRGGQVFFVVPRISRIEGISELLHRLVPDVRVAVAHGRQKDVEERILSFADNNADVLVSTTLIENGLDLPNANLIIITEPQMFGLAELYQLRGRVGRSPRYATALFMYPQNTSMTYDAVRRLSAIQELSSLGSGLELANRDLEIRGAGNLFGSKQSGVVGKVGHEVYLALLREALEEAKGHNALQPVPTCRLRLKKVEQLLENSLSGLPMDTIKSIIRPQETARSYPMNEEPDAPLVQMEQELMGAISSPRDLLELRDVWRTVWSRKLVRDKAVTEGQAIAKEGKGNKDAPKALEGFSAPSPVQSVNQIIPQQLLPPQLEALFKIHLLLSFGRSLGVVEIDADPDGSKDFVELHVPGWSPPVQLALNEALSDAYKQVEGANKVVTLDETSRTVRLHDLRNSSPARKLMVLSSVLAKTFLHHEGTTNFGFET